VPAPISADALADVGVNINAVFTPILASVIVVDAALAVAVKSITLLVLPVRIELTLWLICRL
jgi:hypothetical protein